MTDLSVRFSKCCSPVPGDEIVGFVTRGRGISIHRTDCINILALPADERSRLIEANWAPGSLNSGSGSYEVDIRIYANDRSGLLADISRIFTEKNISLLGVNTRVNKQQIATIQLSFEISGRDELENICDKIRSVQGIVDIFTWGKFAQSLLTYLYYNIIRKVSDKFSVSPWYFFLREFAATFHPLTYISAILLMIFAAVNFRKNRSLVLFFFPFLFFFVVHSAIAHKQPRFVFACCFALLALSSEFFAFLCKKYAKNRKNAAVFLSVFLLFSLDAFPHIKYSTLWNHSTTVVDNFYGHDKGNEKIFGGVLETEAELGRIPDLKRAYLFGIPQIWSGGYSYFHRNAQISFASKSEDIKKMIRKAVDLKQSDSYCAFRNGIGIPEEYRENLKEISNNGDFTIYRLVVE